MYTFEVDHQNYVQTEEPGNIWQFLGLGTCPSQVIPPCQDKLHAWPKSSPTFFLKYVGTYVCVSYDKYPVWTTVRSEQEGELWRVLAICQCWQKCRTSVVPTTCSNWKCYLNLWVLQGGSLWNLYNFFHSRSHVTMMRSASQTVCFSWATEYLSVQDCGEISWQWRERWQLCHY